jgi:hypothetical protein
MKKFKPGIALAILIVLFSGYISHPAANAKAPEPKRITNILMNTNSDSLIFIIKANQSLTYTVNKLALPMGVLLYFPETNLDLDRGVYTPPDNEIISSIKAHEIREDKTTSTRIFFALKKESTYVINEDDAGIKITFPRTKALSDVKTQKKSVKKKPPNEHIQKDQPTDNQLKRVIAKPLKKILQLRSSG